MCFLLDHRGDFKNMVSKWFSVNIRFDKFSKCIFYYPSLGVLIVESAKWWSECKYSEKFVKVKLSENCFQNRFRKSPRWSSKKHIEDVAKKFWYPYLATGELNSVSRYTVEDPWAPLVVWVLRTVVGIEAGASWSEKRGCGGGRPFIAKRYLDFQWYSRDPKIVLGHLECVFYSIIAAIFKIWFQNDFQST